MKRVLRWAVLWTATTIGGALHASPATTPEPPAPPVSAPFAMDKAGATARIDFQVSPEQVKGKRRLMVALDFPQTGQGKVEDAIQQNDFPIQVEVFLLSHGESIAVPTQDNQAILQSASGKQQSAEVAHLHLYGTNGQTSNVLITGFRPSRSGHYYAKVKTVVDLPIFTGIQTTLKVAPFYNTGE